MAKQSGLHQIKGKVGEFSYYKSTGVNGGLIRSINQGLSERVKNSEEYANARLNNQEFGAAANVAGLLGKMVIPKFRPMILPFSQSRMAKDLLILARESSQNWGERVVTAADTARIADILSAQSKRDASEFVDVSVAHSTGRTFEITAQFSVDQSILMKSLGIDTITVTAKVFNVATGQWIPTAKRMATGYIVPLSTVSPIEGESVNPGDESINSVSVQVPVFSPMTGHAGHQLIVFVIMPGRVINDVSHILQEYCSFKAIPLPAVSGQ